MVSDDGGRQYTVASNLNVNATILFSVSGALQKSRPSFSELPALREQVASAVGGLDLVGNRVRQRHFPHRSGEVGALAAAVGKRFDRKPCTVRSPRSMWHSVSVSNVC
jgi:hypothetical protein